MESWIDNHFSGRPSEKHIQAVQDVTAQDAIAPHKVRLESAWVIATVKLGPNLECQRRRGTTDNTTDQALHTHCRSQSKELTIRPRQDVPS